MNKWPKQIVERRLNEFVSYDDSKPYKTNGGK